MYRARRIPGYREFYSCEIHSSIFNTESGSVLGYVVKPQNFDGSHSFAVLLNAYSVKNAAGYFY